MSDAREAGRELDAEIAEKVMGWLVNRSESRHWHTIAAPGIPNPEKMLCDHDCDYRYWSPSRDIADAWTVVEAMGRRGFHCRINTPFEPGRHYFVGFTPHSTSGWNGRPDFESGTLTAPRAICLAALKAVAASPSRAVPDPAHTGEPTE